MSDLISRSKVISVLEQLEEHSLTGKMDISNAIYLLNNQPTAYSVDKVVEELEKAKHEIASEDYCRSIIDKEKCDGRNCFECCAEYLIEIVKQGGVRKDME